MTNEQKGVLQGLLIGIVLSILIVAIGSICDVFNLEKIDNKITIAFNSLIIPGVFLVIAVARLAKYRFFRDTDINGSGLTQGSQQAKILQSLIQNTLEQLCIAFVAYSAWSVTMPAQSMSTIIFAAITFALGRVLFFVNYRKGAGARALGFTLTFYPSAVMIITVLGFKLYNLLH
ncbi:MAPEG family protein [Francisella salina]|uniref:Ribosomal protein L11 n=1 Tax=Francisella salina TaxID=573569 RepID=A0ABN3ZWD3_FRAST|nr:MAPEG family protein [Francisella salina]AEI36613.1 putative Ribosomal protein L11 [Francisella salina]